MDSLADLGWRGGFGLTWTHDPRRMPRQRADFVRKPSIPLPIPDGELLLPGERPGNWLLKPWHSRTVFRAEETDRPRNIGQTSSQQFAAGFQQLLVTGLPIGIVEKEIA